MTIRATVILWVIEPGEDRSDIMGDRAFIACPRKGDIITFEPHGTEYTVIAIKHVINYHLEVHVRCAP